MKICDNIYLIENFLSKKESDTIINDIITYSVFDKFTINNKNLCRTGCFEGDQYDDETTPWLRCPSIEYQKIHQWSKPLGLIKNEIETKTGYNTNIAKLQKYENENCFIGNHSDKIIDLDINTPIFIIRFGEQRTYKLVNKKTKESILVNAPHNSLLIIDYKANLEWTHGIIKEEKKLEPSYSIVYRKSVTYKYKSYIFGERTPFKTKKDLIDYLTSTNSCYNLMSKLDFKNEIVKAYNIENNNICDIKIYDNIIKNSIFPF